MQLIKQDSTAGTVGLGAPEYINPCCSTALDEVRHGEDCLTDVTPDFMQPVHTVAKDIMSIPFGAQSQVLPTITTCGIITDQELEATNSTPIATLNVEHACIVECSPHPLCCQTRVCLGNSTAPTLDLAPDLVWDMRL